MDGSSMLASLGGDIVLWLVYTAFVVVVLAFWQFVLSRFGSF